MAERAGRFRARETLQHQIAAVQQRTDPPGAGHDSASSAYGRGAAAALTWLLTGGAAPLSEVVAAQSPPAATAVVQELAAAEKLIYQRRSPRREFARGVQHALMWAQYATAAPPIPVPRPPSAAAPSG